MSPSSRYGKNLSITLSTGFPAGTNSIIFLGFFKRLIKSSSEEVPETTKSLPSFSNISIESCLEDSPIDEYPFDATFRIKFLPITPKPTKPKSNIKYIF